MAGDRRLSVHHVGGRAGSRAFPILNAFEKDIVNVLYDADAECIEQIREQNAGLSSELQVLPFCLGATSGEGAINITYCPYTSSLYALNPEYRSFYSSKDHMDWPLSETCRIMEKRRVKIVAMDNLFKADDNTVPPPDFLSIDAEGSEYDILSGGLETMRSNVLGIVIEADFHPVFKGQKIFGDTVRLLDENGFNFTRFLNQHEMFQFRVPLGLRGEGIHAVGDVLFLRKLETLDEISDPGKKAGMLRKLAFIAIAFKQFDCAVECLRRSKACATTLTPAETDKLTYLRFLSEFEDEIARMPAVYPPTFAETYTTHAASQTRFQTRAYTEIRETSQWLVLRSRLKRTVKKLPVIYRTLQLLLKLQREAKSRLVAAKKHLFAGHTSIERLLLRYGLKEQADALREKRILHA